MKFGCHMECQALTNGWMYGKSITNRKKKGILLQLKQCSHSAAQSVFQPRYNKLNLKPDCSVIYIHTGGGCSGFAPASGGVR